MMLQKPLNCRNANCGAMCSPVDAEMWSDNPEKCPYYKRVERDEDRPKGHWISIKDRLPEDGTWNIFTDGESISVERYKYDAIDHFFPEGRWFTVEDVVAWMPLPEPYGAEKER